MHNYTHTHVGMDTAHHHKVIRGLLLACIVLPEYLLILWPGLASYTFT